ncbi:MAG TPA: hypothetical protein VM715_14755, partial [Candidatus Acidoferrum sp.]|nr:hypothetical protein [Candidatus Acidoferrum sp.]
DFHVAVVEIPHDCKPLTEFWGLACSVVYLYCCFETKAQCHGAALPGTTTSLQTTTICGYGN